MIYNYNCDILNELMDKKKKRILIIRCGLLGDTIDSTSVIRPLLDYYKDDVEIEWVTKPNLKDLFEFDEKIKPIFVKFTKLPLLLNLDKLKIVIKSFFKPYDAVINLELGKKFISLAKYTNAKLKVGVPQTYVAEDIKNEHRVHHQLRIIESYYKNINHSEAFPYLKGSGINIFNEYQIKNKYIVCCPTNSKFKKQNYRGYRAWPLKNWQDLIDKVIQSTDFDIVITGNNNEKDFINELNFDSHRVHNLCGKTNIPNLVEIMKNAECAIANDSGAVHVAGVSCKKVISLHGPTPFKETGPYGNGDNEIREANINMKCSPCYNTDAIRKCPSNLCMINLTPDKVFNLIIK